MEIRSPYFVVSLIASLVISVAAHAGESVPDTEQQTAWQQRQDEADALKAEGKAHRQAAEKVYEETAAACAAKLLVNGCRNEARKVYVAATKEARAIENKGHALALAVNKEQALDRDRRLAVQLEQREADRQERAAEMSEARQAADEQRAETRSDKARQAELGRQRKAAEAEKLQRKQAAHEARQAARIKEAERRAAEAGGNAK